MKDTSFEREQNFEQIVQWVEEDAARWKWRKRWLV